MEDALIIEKFADERTREEAFKLLLNKYQQKIYWHVRRMILNQGADVTIIATGHLVWEAIQAGEQLEALGIDAEIINIHTIKPLDVQAILASVQKTGCVVTAEEHNRLGGLGDSVAQVLATNLPSPQEFVAVDDSFGESGTPAQLMEKYGLNAAAIVAAAQKVISRK